MHGTAGRSLAFAIVLTILPVAASRAAQITYAIDRTIGSGGVSGTITTDGTTGVLASSNILAWILQLTGGGASDLLVTSNSVVVVSGSDLTATTSGLFFDYSGQDYGRLLFQNGLYSGTHYYCDQATGVSACDEGASVAPESAFDASFQHVALQGSVEIATAGVSAVPLPAALPLFGMAMLALAGLGRRVRRFRPGPASAAVPARSCDRDGTAAR